jgi:hypothetical protein
LTFTQRIDNLEFHELTEFSTADGKTEINDKTFATADPDPEKINI